MTQAPTFGGGMELTPNVPGALGGAIGEGIGRWGGRVLGGLFGGLFGPEAVVPGALLGGRLGAYLGHLGGAALAEWLAHQMDAANAEADKSKDAATDQTATCATCPKRSKPDQTCDDDVLDRLEAAKDVVCGSIFTNDAFKSMNEKRLNRQTCADVLARLNGMRACRAARQEIQDVCFNKEPPEKKDNHKAEIANYDRGIERLVALAARVCPSLPAVS